MRNILRDLYYGNYAAFERTYTRDSEQAKALGIVVDLEEKLRDTLTEVQKDLFKQFDDAVADLASVSNVDSFIEGCHGRSSFNRRSLAPSRWGIS